MTPPQPLAPGHAPPQPPSTQHPAPSTQHQARPPPLRPTLLGARHPFGHPRRRPAQAGRRGILLHAAKRRQAVAAAARAELRPGAQRGAALLPRRRAALLTTYLLTTYWPGAALLPRRCPARLPATAPRPQARQHRISTRWRACAQTDPEPLSEPHPGPQPHLHPTAPTPTHLTPSVPPHLQPPTLSLSLSLSLSLTPLTPPSPGTLVLFDFGLAKLWKIDPNEPGLAARNLSGQTGSARYMAPEVCCKSPFLRPCVLHA